ncbi:enoyl-CoA hydratase [Rhodococcus sp. KBW08]|uniref:enoyl-CoA hydratase/isomerase family protein n=1 Tax=unclassified Rhodococcus (in: high G+C Gram-positive bacteria) TaxID=192944 RepID=UPI000F5A50BF|nr:enoyl-CoA hydratase-related protein [Rhodococcus sp. KBW08]NHP16318.1 enoyl-CoA hydratase [Rhodococcus sp. IC4_135]RQO50930.1 enoyl-CoA hydratase [Rhodococcus sp. KBW08]
MPSQVTCSIAREIATVTLRNTERRNALSIRLLGDLEAILTRLEADREVRVIVLTGSGSAFCVGADLAAPPELRSLRGDSVEGDTARLRAASNVAQHLHLMPQPTVAAINGACAGAGLSLALATDFRVAADTAVFNTAFLGAGLSGDLGGIWFLTHLLGSARARELFLMPGKFDVRRAAEIGLVTAVAPADGLGELTDRITARLASAAPVAVRAMKQNLLGAQALPLAEYLGVEVDRMVHCFHTDDAREAASAFLQRREPVFAGR